MLSRAIERAKTVGLIVLTPLALALAVVLDYFTGWSSYGTARRSKRFVQQAVVLVAGVGLAFAFGQSEKSAELTWAVLTMTAVVMLLLEVGRCGVRLAERLRSARDARIGRRSTGPT